MGSAACCILATCRTQQCFAVKGGVDGFLDIARQTFCRVTEQVEAGRKCGNSAVELLASSARSLVLPHVQAPALSPAACKSCTANGTLRQSVQVHELVNRDRAEHSLPNMRVGAGHGRASRECYTGRAGPPA